MFEIFLQFFKFFFAHSHYKRFREGGIRAAFIHCLHKLSNTTVLNNIFWLKNFSLFCGRKIILGATQTLCCHLQAILRDSVVLVEIEVLPHYLVPDTNCFVDYLPDLQTISEAANSSRQPVYVLMVPLVGEWEYHTIPMNVAGFAYLHFGLSQCLKYTTFLTAHFIFCVLFSLAVFTVFCMMGFTSTGCPKYFLLTYSPLLYAMAPM